MIQKVFGRVCFLLIAMCFSSLSFAEPVWVDVRTAAEHTIDNIEGDIRISAGDIVPEVQKLFPDKNTEIRLYCRSGGRAATATSALIEAGYTNVSSAGGIEDARKKRGLTQ